MKQSLRRSLCATVLLTISTSSALALPPAEHPGETVKSIPGAERISDWNALDNQRVLVNVNATDTYLLTLKQQCHGLGWAQNVTVTMSNNTIWAGFDAIKADGLQCPIDRINKVSAAELLKLQGPTED
jgi:hypothetical protein